MLMDRLVDTTKDVELLDKKRIIENHLGGADDAADLFKKICKQVVLNDFYFAPLSDRVNAYAMEPWNSYFATLKRDYFKTPWSRTKFVAGIAFFAFTIAQLVLASLNYYQTLHK